MSAASAYESPVDRVLRALGACGVKRAGDGKWSSRCPAHADTNPSLSIEVGRNGGVVIHCHKGCETSAVVDAIGLTLQDLFADGGQRAGDRKPTPAGAPVFYVWRNAEGEPVDRKVRQLMSDGKKRMAWEHFEADQWKSGQSEKERRPALYRLPELLAAPSTEVVHIAEGEKCAEALRNLGVIATTTGSATTTLTAEAVSYLEGRRVVLWPDDDRDGAKHMAAHRAALSSVAKSVKVVDRAAFRRWAKPGKDGGGDVADLIADLVGAGQTTDQIRNRLFALVPGSRLRSRFVRVTRDWLITAQPPREYLLFDGRTGRGAIDRKQTWMLGGRGGGGKGFALVALALAIALGGSWFGLETNGRPGRVLMLSAEDDADDLRRRLLDVARLLYPSAAESDIDDRIVIYACQEEVPPFVRHDRETGTFVHGAGLHDVLEAVEEEREAGRGAPFDLVIVDPAAHFAAVSIDVDSAAATALVRACNRLSSAAGGLVLLVHHTSKTSRKETGDGKAAEATDLRGSTGLIDGPRGAIMLTPEVDKATRKPTGIVTLSIAKANHVRHWDDIILRRDESGVLHPLDAPDVAEYKAARGPEAKKAQRAAETQAKKAAAAAASFELAEKYKAERAARDAARKKAEQDADVLAVREIIAAGYRGKLRDLVEARLRCGSARAGRAIALAQVGQALPVSSIAPPPNPPYPLVSKTPGDTGGVPACLPGGVSETPGDTAGHRGTPQEDPS